MTLLRSKGIGTLLVYSAEVHEEDGVSSTSHIPPYKENIAEVARVIEAAAEFERTSREQGNARGKTWCAIKLTALLPDAESIERLSTYLAPRESDSTDRWAWLRGHTKATRVPYPHTPECDEFDGLLAERKVDPASPLTQEDIESIRELYDNLRGLCRTAKEKGVTVVFDSEHTWCVGRLDLFLSVVESRAH